MGREEQFSAYREALKRRLAAAKEAGDAGRSEIRGADGEVVGSAEEATRRTVAWSEKGGIRSPREDEIAQMSDKELEEELAIYMCRLMC
jgi:hypothetical protein